MPYARTELAMTNDTAADKVSTERLQSTGPSELLFMAATTFDRFTGQMRRAVGINAHERLAVAILWERGAMTMSELGGWIPLSRAAVTTLVDRLEAEGHVVREPDRNDRRRTLVRTTLGVQQRLFPIVDQWSTSMRAVAVEFGDDWAVIERFLQRYREVTNDHAERLCALDDEQIQGLAPVLA